MKINELGKNIMKIVVREKNWKAHLVTNENLSTSGLHACTRFNDFPE